jgi:hypothetical protein
MIRTPALLPILAGTIEETSKYLQTIFSDSEETQEQDPLKEKLALEIIPFRYAKRVQYNIHNKPKDDELRIAFQTLFLFVLRPFIKLKCKK